MATWVLEAEVYSDADEALASAVADSGGRVVWWQDDWWSDGRWPTFDGPVVFHGSLGNADRIGRELSWNPGVFCSTARFACSSWWPGAAEFLISPRYEVSTVRDLVRSGPPADFGSRVFVRPDSPLKPFSGRVLDRGGITLGALDHGYYYDDDELAVVVTPAVSITAEWRFVVVGGRVVAGSEYTPDGRVGGTTVSSTHPAWAYADTVAATVIAPDPVFVLDVCESGIGLHLLELNPFSGADLYGCDRSAVVDAVGVLLA